MDNDLMMDTIKISYELARPPAAGKPQEGG